jgi:hypothetical protein
MALRFPMAASPSRTDDRVTVRAGGACLFILLGAFGPGCHLQRGDAPPETTEDGLVIADVPGIDLAYLRPGSSLLPYRRIMLDPVQVEFGEDWDPEHTGSRMKLSAEEREQVRASVADTFMKNFKKEMEKGDYLVVDETAPDVLRITPKLVDVYVNAPDVMTPGRTRTYVKSAGRMTLVADLRDAQTGAILARVRDEEKAPEDFNFQLSSSVENYAQASRIVSEWARNLRARLDTVRMQSEADKPVTPSEP